MRMRVWSLALAGVVTAATLIAGAAGPEAETVTLGLPGRANATPWVAADGRFVAIVWGVAAGEKRSDVMLAVSRDGGATFGAPVRVNREPGTARLGGELPPRVVLAPPSALPSSGARASGADPEIIVLWNARAAATSIEVARSRDGGRTFSAPESLQAPDAAGDRGWPALAADRRGVAHAIWLDHRGLAAAKAAGTGGSSGAAHKHGAGAHGGSAPASGAGHASPMDGTAMAQRSSLYYARVGRAQPASAQGASAQPVTVRPASARSAGAAASPASLAAAPASAPRETSIAPGVCYCCKTALAIGRDGEIFAAWRHVYPGNLRDIAFTVSKDEGRSFAAPVKVSEDRWEINGCPDDGPAMAVGADGTLHIVWPTVVGEGDEMRGALFYATSRDGRRFSARQRIPTGDTLKPMHPQIAIDAAGQVLVAWDEFIAGNRRVARVARLLRPDTFGAPLTIGGATAADDAQYPLLAATSRGLIAVWTRGAQGATTIAVRPVSVPAS